MSPSDTLPSLQRLTAHMGGTCHRDQPIDQENWAELSQTHTPTAEGEKEDTLERSETYILIVYGFLWTHQNEQRSNVTLNDTIKRIDQINKRRYNTRSGCQTGYSALRRAKTARPHDGTIYTEKFDKTFSCKVK